MASNRNDLLDPSVCSCFSRSYHYSICRKIKWSTVSFGMALLIMILYLSSGLYALIDATTIRPNRVNNDSIFWLISSSSFLSIVGWVSVSIYFTVVLLITILLCGIQLGKPWLLFTWSIMMVFMLVMDAIATVLFLREHQHYNYRPLKQIQILFFVMTIRLLVSLCGIFLTLFHFRRLTKAHSEHRNRERMLARFNSDSSSPSYPESCVQSATALNPLKANHDDYYGTNASPDDSLPRIKMTTNHHNPTPVIICSYNQQSEYPSQSNRRIIHKNINDFRYNIPLHERFHQPSINDMQKF